MGEKRIIRAKRIMERSRIVGNIGNWGREWRILEENEELRETRNCGS